MDNSKISADPEALESAAEKVDSSVNEIRNDINRFRSVIEGLNTSWSSDVKNKFFTSFNNDMKALSEMIEQYSEVSAGLRTIAENYRRTEEEITANIEKARKACG